MEVRRAPYKFIRALLLITTALFLLSGCGSQGKAEPVMEEAASLSAEAAPDEDMKAGGTAVVISRDLNNGRIDFAAVESGERYSLLFNRKTVFTDAYGAAMVAEELQAGDIVDLVVSVHSRLLSEVKERGDAFFEPGIRDYDININRGVFSTGGQNYRIKDSTLVLIGDTLARFEDIKKGDSLAIKGIGRDVHVIILQNGIGFVRVTGAESFKGGWVQIGNLIEPVGEEMLFSVPAGRHTLTVSYHRFGGDKEVLVERGQETLVDVSDLKGDLLKNGEITFSFDPEDAEPQVRIDGARHDWHYPIELEYGVHTLDIKAEGYLPIRRYLSVGQPAANLEVILEEDTEAASGEKSGSSESASSSSSSSSAYIPGDLPTTFRTGEGANTSSTSSLTSSSTLNDTGTAGGGAAVTLAPQLYIDAPAGAEVYFDGSYKGIAPCHFAKVNGAHVITLMKNGFITKSYTLTLASDGGDETYSFNELEAEPEPPQREHIEEEEE
ncbi:MAG: PEGA domain-containing protein, partial [Lachnospiraceae bacterium]|nr:PEGA domain-containing protein [Lachnospiraceae bacterium]